jgi:hypothetical protein
MSVASVMNIKTSLWLRGVAKVVAIAVLINQILTMLFSWGARAIDPNVASEIITIFSFMTSMAAGFWIQADARRAYAHAKQHGWVKSQKGSDVPWVLAPECPHKWLVTLYLELNPALADL